MSPAFSASQLPAREGRVPGDGAARTGRPARGSRDRVGAVQGEAGAMRVAIFSAVQHEMEQSMSPLYTYRCPSCGFAGDLLVRREDLEAPRCCAKCATQMSRDFPSGVSPLGKARGQPAARAAQSDGGEGGTYRFIGGEISSPNYGILAEAPANIELDGTRVRGGRTGIHMKGGTLKTKNLDIE